MSYEIRILRGDKWRAIDIPKDFVIRTTVQNYDLKKLDKYQNSFTLQTELDYSYRNEKAFGFIHTSKFYENNKSRSYPCLVFQDGKELLPLDTIVIEDITVEKNYKVLFLSAEKQLFTFTDRSCRSLDFSKIADGVGGNPNLNNFRLGLKLENERHWTDGYCHALKVDRNHGDSLDLNRDTTTDVDNFNTRLLEYTRPFRNLPIQNLMTTGDIIVKHGNLQSSTHNFNTPRYAAYNFPDKNFIDRVYLYGYNNPSFFVRWLIEQALSEEGLNVDFTGFEDLINDLLITSTDLEYEPIGVEQSEEFPENTSARGYNLVESPNPNQTFAALVSANDYEYKLSDTAPDISVKQLIKDFMFLNKLTVYFDKVSRKYKFASLSDFPQHFRDLDQFIDQREEIEINFQPIFARQNNFKFGDDEFRIFDNEKLTDGLREDENTIYESDVKLSLTNSFSLRVCDARRNWIEAQEGQESVGLTPEDFETPDFYYGLYRRLDLDRKIYLGDVLTHEVDYKDGEQTYQERIIFGYKSITEENLQNFSYFTNMQPKNFDIIEEGQTVNTCEQIRRASPNASAGRYVIRQFGTEQQKQNDIFIRDFINRYYNNETEVEVKCLFPENYFENVEFPLYFKSKILNGFYYLNKIDQYVPGKLADVKLFKIER